MANDERKAETLLYQCVVVQPTEGQYKVGEPVIAESFLYRNQPHLLVQGVLEKSVKTRTTVEEFRKGVSSLVEKLLKEHGTGFVTLDDICGILVKADYWARQLPPKTL